MTDTLFPELPAQPLTSPNQAPEPAFDLLAHLADVDALRAFEDECDNDEEDPDFPGEPICP